MRGEEGEKMGRLEEQKAIKNLLLP